MKWRWKNFTPAEMRCKGTGKDIPLNAKTKAALDKLQLMREIVGKPFVINSAYRTPSHNQRVKGASRSMHLTGQAFDIRLEGHDPKLLYSAAKRAGFKGIGFHPSFIHVDDRDQTREFEYSGFPARHLFINHDRYVYDEDILEKENPELIVAQADRYIVDSATTGKEKAAIAVTSVAGGAGVIEIVQNVSPALSGLSMLDWRVGLMVVILAAIGGVIWLWRRKR